VFYQKEDGSIWIDLTAEGLDQKVVLRSNGTTVYITQDIATANEKDRDYKLDKSIYVVGNEQEYHFKVLFSILKKLGKPYADNLFHLSYGMVELPEGKMKSREGTVVDADDLVDELIRDVRAASEERATLEGLADANKLNIWRKVALGALKFYILKVEPKKGMVFDPKQSIDLQGHTGPYIQNAFVRTQSVQRAFAQKQVKTEGVWTIGLTGFFFQQEEVHLSVQITLEQLLVSIDFMFLMVLLFLSHLEIFFLNQQQEPKQGEPKA
jgi:arginyl-tRNA synthetase